MNSSTVDYRYRFIPNTEVNNVVGYSATGFIITQQPDGSTAIGNDRVVDPFKDHIKRRREWRAYLQPQEPLAPANDIAFLNLASSEYSSINTSYPYLTDDSGQKGVKALERPISMNCCKDRQNGGGPGLASGYQLARYNDKRYRQIMAEMLK
jgi:hypothetical protein